MSDPQPYDPRQQKILSPEEQAMQQPYSMRFPKETRSKDEQTQRLDSFLRTLGPEKANKSSDTASQKSNAHSKDNFDVLNRQLNDPEIKNGHDTSKAMLTTEQSKRGYDDIIRFMDINHRLNETNKKLTDDYMILKDVKPEEFRKVGKELHQYLNDDLKGNQVPIYAYNVAQRKFNSMLTKLDIIRAKL
ncbi:MAG TPA: hypothetical protein VGL94_01305 [Ktedonobacteraceae bacterium]|jgi:hypothetical protein